MLLSSISNLFLGQDNVQVNDQFLTNKSYWNLKELVANHPDLNVEIITHNKSGFIFYVSQDAAIKLIKTKTSN